MAKRRQSSGRRGLRTCRQLRLEALEPRLLLATDFQNPFDLFDLNQDSTVDAADVPLIQDTLKGIGYRRIVKGPVTTPSGINTAFDLDHSVAQTVRNEFVLVRTALMTVGSLQPEASSSTLPLPAAGLQQATAVDPVDRSDLVNLDADTDVSYSGIFHNRRTRQSKTNVVVTNTSALPIDSPLILVIESISDATVTVANADGTVTPDGKPYFDLTGQIPGETLDPGESTNNRPLIFNNPRLRPFTIQASVFRQDTSPVTPSVNFEVPTDALGRRFIGVPIGLDITIRADGTDPVTIDLGQNPAAEGSRGVVFFGENGFETTATVTTSGGTDNTAQIRVRGDADHPSAFQGDLDLTASLGGTEVSTERVTVIKIALDAYISTLQNDRPALRTVTKIPATPDLEIFSEFSRGIMVEGGLLPNFFPSDLSVNVIPLDGSTIRTGANGTAGFIVRQGAAGQGYAIGTLNNPQSGTKSGYVNEEMGNDAERPTEEQSDETDQGKDIIKLYSGEKRLDIADLTILGRGFDYQFTRTYRSQVSHLRPVATNDFGVDWAFSYSDDRLIQDGDNVAE